MFAVSVSVFTSRRKKHFKRTFPANSNERPTSGFRYTSLQFSTEGWGKHNPTLTQVFGRMGGVNTISVHSLSVYAKSTILLPEPPWTSRTIAANAES